MKELNLAIEVLEERIAPDSINGVPGESNGNPGQQHCGFARELTSMTGKVCRSLRRAFPAQTRERAYSVSALKQTFSHKSETFF